jgi:broad specificity phosphatase PhoE
MELSPLGHRQARALASYLAKRRFDAFYASPMKRVRQTLLPLLEQGMPEPAIVEGFREVDFGDWTGLSWIEVGRKFGVSAFNWLDQLEADAIPNCESASALRARVEPPFRRILAQHAGQNVAIACHGGVIRMMLSILLELPVPRMAAFEIEYTSITQVSYLPGRARLELLNFTPWRDLQP